MVCYVAVCSQVTVECCVVLSGYCGVQLCAFRLLWCVVLRSWQLCYGGVLCCVAVYIQSTLVAVLCSSVESGYCVVLYCAKNGWLT